MTEAPRAAGQSLFSPNWYRVAELKPRLRSHIELHRHRYRGDVWYVLEDHSSERYYRFTPPAYFVISLMDGRRSVQEIWTRAGAELGEEAPSQEEMVALLSQLHAADALQSDVAPDTTELFQRYQRQRSMRVKGQLMSPLFWRVPLVDPDRFLDRMLPHVRRLLGRLGLLVWLLVVGTGLVLLAVHWNDLTQDFVDRVLLPSNLLVIWLVFPFLKVFHELGHAFATKHYGGEVHEMGIMFLILTPLPYVDASSSSAFRRKRERVLVGAAGMIVETFIASIALMVWLNVQPGAVRSIAYNVLLIGGISTIAFNANPLLRYDGYYILSDLIELPNLRQRSTRYVAYLAERYFLGNRFAVRPPGTVSERAWFAVYGVASFFYRLGVLLGIVFFIASRFFFLGMALALWSTVAWGVFPLVRILRYVFTSSRLRRVRRRATLATTGAILALLAIVFFLPLPLSSMAEGIVWIPEGAIVRAEVDGFVRECVPRPGDRVQAGDVLFRCEDPALTAEVRSLEGRVAELRATHAAVRRVDRVRAAVLEEELEHTLESLEFARARLAKQVVRSPFDGTFVAPNAADFIGRLAPRGAPLARVIDLDTLRTRVVVRQDEVDLVRRRTRRVDVRLAERLGQTIEADVIREVPGASQSLPSSALGSAGGGRVAVDPRDPNGLRTIERIFQFELELPAELGVVNAGGRVHVRFQHGWEPVVHRWYRSLRQLLLSRFDLG